MPCPQTPGSDCSRCDNHWGGKGGWHNTGASHEPPCAGCQGSTHTKAIRDVVKVPSTLKAGRYILGWRYDCEATAQVWSNCADITLA